jgi:hypothetical protein
VPKRVSARSGTEEFKNNNDFLRCCTTNSSVKENGDGDAESLLF